MASTDNATPRVVEVKHGKLRYEIIFPDDTCTVDWLMEQIESKTDPTVMKKHQKLLAKGKALVAGESLDPQVVFKNGKTTVMLLASAGGGGAPPAPPTAGEKALKESRAAKAADAIKRKLEETSTSKPEPHKVDTIASRVNAWRTTGIIGLRDLSLTALPDEAFEPTLSPSIRVVDVSLNKLTELPASIAVWVGCNKFKLGGNKFTSQSVPWTQLTLLPNITHLNLENNCLTGALPGCLPAMQKLQVLSLDGNKITKINTGEDGDKKIKTFFPSLRIISFANNRVAEIPAQFGQCAELESIDGIGNYITSLPVQLSQCSKLKTLLLDRNCRLDVDGIPSDLLKHSKVLDNLSLHGCALEMELLREKEGWAEYNGRRQTRAGKVLESKVLLGSSAFDEGGDVERRRRH